MLMYAYFHRCWVEWPAAEPVKSKTVEAETHIAHVSEWGSACARGFVSDSRFPSGGGEVIKRTSRDTSRRWRRAAGPPG